MISIESNGARQDRYAAVLAGKLSDNASRTMAETRVLIKRSRERDRDYRVRPYNPLGYRPPKPETIGARPTFAALRAVQQRLRARTILADTLDETAEQAPSQPASASG